MRKFFTLRWWIVLLIYFFLDIVATGAGMGVPFFCIILGFPTGWYLTRRYLMLSGEIKQVFKKTLRDSLIASGITLAGMAGLWLPALGRLFGTEADIVNFGIPMILYEPRASLAGWLALMIIISPILELLAATFASYLTVMRRVGRSGKNQA